MKINKIEMFGVGGRVYEIGSFLLFIICQWDPHEEQQVIIFTMDHPHNDPFYRIYFDLFSMPSNRCQIDIETISHVRKIVERIIKSLYC